MRMDPGGAVSDREFVTNDQCGESQPRKIRGHVGGLAPECSYGSNRKSSVIS